LMAAILIYSSKNYPPTIFNKPNLRKYLLSDFPMATKIFKPVSLLNDGHFDEFMTKINAMSPDDIKVCFAILIEKYKDLKARFGVDNERALDLENPTDPQLQPTDTSQEKITDQQERIKELLHSYSDEILKNETLREAKSTENEKFLTLEQNFFTQKQKYENLQDLFSELSQTKISHESTLLKESKKCRKLHELCSDEILKNENLTHQLSQINSKNSDLDLTILQMTTQKIDSKLLLEKFQNRFDKLSTENQNLHQKCEDQNDLLSTYQKDHFLNPQNEPICKINRKIFFEQSPTIFL
jgi:myosin heavy subunit